MKNDDVYLKTEVGRCLLCHDAPCSKVCKNMDVSGIIRSIRFDNSDGAAARIADAGICSRCEKQVCLKACNRAKVDRALDIPFIIRYAKEHGKEIPEDLPSPAVDFCGVHCENPFVMASSVITCRRSM